MRRGRKLFPVLLVLLSLFEGWENCGTKRLSNLSTFASLYTFICNLIT